MYLSVLLSQIYSNVVPFVILLGILIFVHELGHFMVARWCGVRVEVFSLGFGKKIFSYKKGDTTYCISIIPLGGYVKMFGEQNGDSVAENEKSVSFTHKTVWQRIAIVLAGPLMNFFFAVFVFGFIAQIGEETRSAIIAEVTKGSEAEKMGLETGDKFIKINDEEIQSYEDLQKVFNLYKNKNVKATLEKSNKETKNLDLQISSIKNPNIFSIETEIGSINGIQALAKSSLIAVLSDSSAHKLGFRSGDEITFLDNQKVSKWNNLEAFFEKAKSTNQDVDVKVERETTDGKPKETVILKIPKDTLVTFSDLKKFGFDNPDLYLDQVIKGSPAEQADLKKYDKIVSINSKKIEKWEDVLNTVKNFDGKEALLFEVLRDGTSLLKKITPQVTSQMTALGQEDKRYTIGILPLVMFAQPEMTKVYSKSVFHSLIKGFSRSLDISGMTVFSFVKLFQGEVSHKNIGGMISIGKAAKDSFEMGMQAFLSTMGILSISLFILNLLPIPVLDGGHLVFYSIEVIKGSPLSVKKMEIAQQIGFILLMGLMVLALFNDFTKFFFKT